MVQVRLKEYGSELIEVADNGSGIASHDYQSATLKHYTSKLTDFRDLEVCTTECNKVERTTCERQVDGWLMRAIPTDRTQSAGFGHARLPRGGLEFTVCPGRRQHRHSHSRGFCWDEAGIRSRWCPCLASNNSTCHGDHCCGQRHFQAAASAVPGVFHSTCSPPAHKNSVVILLYIKFQSVMLLQPHCRKCKGMCAAASPS